MGDLGRSNPVLQRLNLPPVGRAERGHVLLTKTLLIVGQEGSTQRADGGERGSAIAMDSTVHDPKLCAYDKTTGKVVGEVTLPRNATGAPMTYMLDGKQFIVVSTGGANLPAEQVANPAAPAAVCRTCLVYRDSARRMTQGSAPAAARFRGFFLSPSRGSQPIEEQASCRIAPRKSGRKRVLLPLSFA